MCVAGAIGSHGSASPVREPPSTPLHLDYNPPRLNARAFCHPTPTFYFYMNTCDLSAGTACQASRLGLASFPCLCRALPRVYRGHRPLLDLSLHSLALSPSQAHFVTCYCLNSVACMAVAGRYPVGTSWLHVLKHQLTRPLPDQNAAGTVHLLRMPRPLDTLFSLSLLLES